MTANTHLEHPEDMVFTHGLQGFMLDFFYGLPKDHKVSVKWDGAPALVWGRCPSTNEFFVGTKSVFNKKLIKINYNHRDIDRNHQGVVAKILHVAFECLPVPSQGYLQGDFIGFGGSDVFQPNTIEYRFSSVITNSIVVAVHTAYRGAFLQPTASYGISVDDIRFDDKRSSRCYLIDTTHAHINFRNPVQRLIDTAKVKWFTLRSKQPVDTASQNYLKTHVNSFIRSGSFPSAQIMYDSLPDKYKCKVNVDLFYLYHIIHDLKMRVLKQVEVTNDTECFIDGQPTDPEGFVISNYKQTYKLVDRLEFSKANFTLNKNWTNEKV